MGRLERGKSSELRGKIPKAYGARWEPQNVRKQNCRKKEMLSHVTMERGKVVVEGGGIL